MVHSLIEKCEACEGNQYADIIDNCDLFRGKIVSLWYDFVHLSRIETTPSDMETRVIEKVASEILVSR